MRDFALEIIEEKDMTQQLDQQIRELLCICFPADAEIFCNLRPWNNVQPEYSVIYQENGRLLGHVGIVYREILCGDVPVAVAGVQSMAVHPDRRGTGLAQAIMRESMAEAARRGIDFGMLFCVESLANTFYSRLGWIRINERVMVMDESGKTTDLPAKNVAMYLPLSGKPFPPGPINLQGREW